jgi:flagellar secretion chaperone FliS
MRSAADEYLETQVMTAAPERLHLMVVDAALRNARHACAALEAQDYETSFFALNRARDCVNELVTAIRNDPNPELAAQLKSLFLFVHRNLVNADLVHDLESARAAIRILEMHRETWLTLMERLQQERNTLKGPHTQRQVESSWVT